MNLQKLTLGCSAFVLAIGLASAGNCWAAPATDYAIFGNLGVTIGQGSNITGTVASNADITVGGLTTFSGLTGGGSLFSSGGGLTVNGDVTFNGNVTTGSSTTITGLVNSGGNVTLGFAQAKTGSITAAGNVLQGQSATTTGDIRAGGLFSNQPFSVVNGNVFTNGTATVNGTVNGNVTHAGALTVGPFGAVTGFTPIGTSLVTPTAYTPAITPGAILFSSGGANVTSGGSLATPLAPGSYGNLSIGTFGKLYLTAGNYYFDSFSFSGNSIRLLNVSANTPIRVYVTGDLFEDGFTDMTVNEVPFASANPSLAGSVLFETLGNYSQNSSGSVNFFGTLFAPNGDITLGSFASVTGSMIAGGHVNVSVGLTQKYVAPIALPEPASMGLLAAGILPLLMRRRLPGSKT